jgi:hypothetical protein
LTVGRAPVVELSGHLRVQRHKPGSLTLLIDSFGAGERLDGPPVAVWRNSHDRCALYPHTIGVVEEHDRRIADTIGACHTTSVRVTSRSNALPTLP